MINKYQVLPLVNGWDESASLQRDADLVILRRDYVPKEECELWEQRAMKAMELDLNSAQAAHKAQEQVKVLVEAAYIARWRFSELNGIVSEEIWNNNYYAVHALDEALAQSEEVKP